MSIQILVAFLYASKKLSEMEIKKAMLFTTDTQKLVYK